MRSITSFSSLRETRMGIRMCVQVGNPIGSVRERGGGGRKTVACTARVLPWFFRQRPLLNVDCHQLRTHCHQNSTKMMKLLLLVAIAGTANAWVQGPSSATRQPTQLKESFGIGYAEDTYDNQPDFLKGEAEYKQWVNKIDANNMLNRKVRCGCYLALRRFGLWLWLDLTVATMYSLRYYYQYNVLGRVRELNLLKATADAGVLSKLEANGVDLATIEKLLPLAEQYGLLSLAGNNQQLLVNGVAPLVVEGAPLLLPLVAGALGAGPTAFYLGAAAFGGLEAYLVANDVELPLIGLSAGAVLGLLLVPLTIVSAGVGAALAAAKK